MKTLIVVDMQHDFIDGALGTSEAVTACALVSKTIDEFSDQQLIYTLDTHDEDYAHTLEGKLLPVVHCVKGTLGAQLTNHEDIAHKLKMYGAICVEKPSFGSLDLPKYIDPATEEIVLVGVCTDICVISNALLLRAQFPNVPITIIKDACAGTTEQNHQAALIVAQSCQIKVL